MTLETGNKQLRKIFDFFETKFFFLYFLYSLLFAELILNSVTGLNSGKNYSGPLFFPPIKLEPELNLNWLFFIYIIFHRFNVNNFTDNLLFEKTDLEKHHWTLVCLAMVFSVLFFACNWIWSTLRPVMIGHH